MPTSFDRNATNGCVSTMGRKTLVVLVCAIAVKPNPKMKVQAVNIFTDLMMIMIECILSKANLVASQFFLKTRAKVEM